jgi:ABC-type phosphate transport system permease subunit
MFDISTWKIVLVGTPSIVVGMVFWLIVKHLWFDS